MRLIFEWQEPTTDPASRENIEARVATTMQASAWSMHRRGDLVINFVPDLPANSALVATVVMAKTGKLLGAIELSADRQSINLIPLDPPGSEQRAL